MRIERILAPNPGVYTLEGTNTWVVGRGPSLVIDPGPDDDAHLRRVAEVAGDVGAIVVTHGHEDHAPGAVGLARRIGVPFHAFDPVGGGLPLADGDRFVTGEGDVVVAHTPGHSPDSVAFHVPAIGALFTGDSVLGRGTSMIDAPEGVLIDYLASLRRMRALEPRVIYPGHGPVVEDGVAKLDGYIAHRSEREAQVVAALAAGDQTIGRIVSRIYADHPVEVWPLAERSVLAHLIGLAAEGRVVERDGSWMLTGRGPKGPAR